MNRNKYEMFNVNLLLINITYCNFSFIYTCISDEEIVCIHHNSHQNVVNLNYTTYLNEKFFNVQYF